MGISDLMPIRAGRRALCCRRDHKLVSDTDLPCLAPLSQCLRAVQGQRPIATVRSAIAAAHGPVVTRAVRRDTAQIAVAYFTGLRTSEHAPTRAVPLRYERMLVIAIPNGNVPNCPHIVRSCRCHAG